jgi:hypothetical protein
MIRQSAILLLTLLSAGRPASAANDYPTQARVDYVIGCMLSNGQTQEMLQRCSCSIDVIASLLPYDRYERADTILRLSAMRSEAGSMFREGTWAKSAVEELRRAQIEADFRCF